MIETKLIHVRNEIGVMENEIKKDFIYNFAWNGESLFKLYCEERHLKTIKDYVIAKVKDDDVAAIKSKIREYLTECVLRGGELMTRSTGHLHSLSSLWEKEVAAKMLSLWEYKL